MHVPKYRKQSGRDFAFVEYDGKRRRLPGTYNSVESRDAYAAFVGRILRDSHKPSPPPEAEGLTVTALVLAFLDHAKTHYAAENSWHGEYANFRFALRRLVGEFGDYQAENFGPLRLKALQQKLADEGLSGGYVNACIAKVKRCFKWAVAQELLRVEVHQALCTVPGLRAKRRKKMPVPWEHVEPVIAALNPVVAAMLSFQWYTGARSGSIIRATPSQFDCSGELWLWTLRHKTEHTDSGAELVLPIGPRCQAVLRPFIDRAPDAMLFNPREARAGRKPNRRCRSQYTPRTYRQAVRRGIFKVNDARTEAAEKAGEVPSLIPLWHPHQLRHSKGHAVRHRYGVEAEQAVLGHASLEAAQLYSEKRFALAAEVARETG